MTTPPQPLTIVSGEATPVGLAFRLPVSHFLHTRKQTENIMVRLTASDGTVGWGECVPRDYVSGETPESVLKVLVGLVPRLIGQTFDRPAVLVRMLAELGAGFIESGHPAAFCALELAALDLAGKVWNMTAGDLLDIPARTDTLTYSLVVPFLEERALAAFLATARPFGFRHVKVKVMAEDPASRVRLVRDILGDEAELRVDANCAWEKADAMQHMRDMAVLGVVSVEQPLAAGNLDGMAALRGDDLPLVALDESVRTPEDIERIAHAAAADILNIRVSKCGGLVGALAMLDAAGRHGLGVQLGAHVGESCILSAAGAILAAGRPGFRWLEGCFGEHLLEADLCAAPFQFAPGGSFSPPKGPGLGVTVDPERLARVTLATGPAGGTSDSGCLITKERS